MDSPKRNQVDWIILLCLNVTVPAILVWETHSGEVTPTVAIASGLVCLFFLNSAVLLTFHTRTRRGGPPLSKVKVLGAIGLALLAAVVLITAVLAMPQRNRYLDLALSQVPLSSIQPERDRLVVELIRRRAENSREYEDLLAEARKHPISPPLYSPESFASGLVMRSTIEQLTKYSDIDFQYFQNQQDALSEFRAKMRTVYAPYLASLEGERKGQEAAEQSASRLEHLWLESIDSLYGLAENHSKEISLRNGHLEFATDALKFEFNDKLDKSKTLYDKWQELTQGLTREQMRAKTVLP